MRWQVHVVKNIAGAGVAFRNSVAFDQSRAWRHEHPNRRSFDSLHFVTAAQDDTSVLR